jgi:hypothetical protein
MVLSKRAMEIRDNKAIVKLQRFWRNKVWAVVFTRSVRFLTLTF